jgi:hypothetical protein
MCGPQGCAGEGGTVKGKALRARAAGAARPLTALTPAPGSGHTHEEHQTRVRAPDCGTGGASDKIAVLNVLGVGDAPARSQPLFQNSFSKSFHCGCVRVAVIRALPAKLRNTRMSDRTIRRLALLDAWQ